MAAYAHNAALVNVPVKDRPEFVKPSDFAHWLERPIELNTAMKEWH